MVKNRFIRSFAAAFMLIVFAFSVTPTIILHNWFANHKDSVRKLADNNQDRVSKRFFNCHCDNIVAESPFTGPGKTIISAPLQIFSVGKADKTVQLSGAPSIYYSLRGPPVV